MEITDELIARLLGEAALNPRLRVNVDLRNSASDASQRMLNALLPGTKVDIHRHPMSSESVVCLSGCLDEVFVLRRGSTDARFSQAYGIRWRFSSQA